MGGFAIIENFMIQDNFFINISKLLDPWPNGDNATNPLLYYVFFNFSRRVVQIEQKPDTLITELHLLQCSSGVISHPLAREQSEYKCTCAWSLPLIWKRPSVGGFFLSFSSRLCWMNVEHVSPKTKLIEIITVNTNRINPSVGSI